MKSQDAPPLTGPSELGTSINVSVAPDLLTQDGGSQSVVTVTAYDSNGKPLRNLSLRSQIEVGNVPADFGSLSARSIVTGNDGRATLVYTAPAGPTGPTADAGTTVRIVVTPLGTNYDNTMSRFATIRLVPPGVVVAPDGLQPYFSVSVPSPADHQTVVFDACNDPQVSCARTNNPVVSYAWSFGDGGSASGRTASHSYTTPGSYVVKLTITDIIGSSGSVSKAIDVGAGVGPTVAFVTSPSAPRVGEVVNLNAAGTKAAPGRTIRSYEWNFGDGESKTTTTPATTHDYVRRGTFTVTLTVTDDAGRTASATQSVTVQTDAPTADFSSTQTGVLAIRFNPVGSQAIDGRTIAGYSWDFGDGRVSTQATPTNVYSAPGIYNVTLTVTDSAGKTGTVTKSVTVL